MSKSQEMMRLFVKATHSYGKYHSARSFNNKERFHQLYLNEKSQLQAIADSIPEWISVEDRLPDENNLCVVKEEGLNEVNVGFYTTWSDAEEKKKACWESNNPDETLCKVTHWMPLPEPPKGK